MAASQDSNEAQYGPWNPGISSRVPSELRPLATIFRPENVYTSVARADEMRDLTGLDSRELVAFRPRRLALHELLVRVTADISVPDGSRIEDLGINFRQITNVILSRYVEPRSAEIDATYEALRREVSTLVESELDPLFPSAGAQPPAGPKRRSGLRALLFRREPHETLMESAPNGERVLLAEWERKAQTSDDMHRAAYRALARVVSALLIRHERVWGGRDLIGSLATDIATNRFAGDAIGRLLEPSIEEASRREGYARLARQEHPVVMNTKGASASGKSTLRPLQKKLAGEIGVEWSEFALISPDIWRKQLLDYGSLGSAYKYGGAFTGDEVLIVDQKLDRYMARKAQRGEMSHLLIDRFRFDSFAPDSNEAGSNLLTRFGHTVYLFFMITPPESLVVRAWNRGLEVGRYKAVDDTLAHSIEAYSGMPELFFTWVRRSDKQVQFEFLDNSVAQGERPRTVAMGTNDTLYVLDVKCMLDVERFRRVDVDARTPATLFVDRALLAPDLNCEFLRQCAANFRESSFVERSTGRIYLHLASGRAAWCDHPVLERALADPDTRAGILAVAPGILSERPPPPDSPRSIHDPAEVRPIHRIGS
jgi:hypothetical protein